jgi:hypothetical protein
MKEIHFTLDLSAQQCRGYYSGATRFVLIEDRNGKRTQFPASALRRFIGHDGVHGRFVLHYGDDNKLIALERVGDLPR